MPEISFGNSVSYSVVFYSRISKTCVVLANTEEFLAEALTVARALKVDEIIIVAPYSFKSLQPSEAYRVFRFK